MGNDAAKDTGSCYVTCRNGHRFATRARGGSTVSCPACRRESGVRVAVWVPVDRQEARVSGIHLSDALFARVAASPLTIPQLIERGLDCTGQHGQDAGRIDGLEGRLAALERQHAAASSPDRARRPLAAWMGELRTAASGPLVTADEAAALTGVTVTRARQLLALAGKAGLITRLEPEPRLGRGSGRNPSRWDLTLKETP